MSTDNEQTSNTEPSFAPPRALSQRFHQLRFKWMGHTTGDYSLEAIQQTIADRNAILAEAEALQKDFQLAFFQTLASDEADHLNTQRLRDMIHEYQQTALALNRLMDEIMLDRVNLMTGSRNRIRAELKERPNSAFHDEPHQEY